MPKHPAPKLNPEWVREARDYFKQFLKVTKFPHPVRNGARGSEFDYPEWLVMFIAVLSVKAKVKSVTSILCINLRCQRESIVINFIPKLIPAAGGRVERP
jgi:hypothetical protein